MLERITAISKITVVKTQRVLYSTYVNHHGAAVVTLLLDFARRKELCININININITCGRLF